MISVIVCVFFNISALFGGANFKFGNPVQDFHSKLKGIKMKSITEFISLLLFNKVHLYIYIFNF